MTIAPDTAVSPAIFLHIPKTAGSTLYRILGNHYPFKNIYTVWQDGSLDEFKQLTPEQHTSIRLLRGHFGYGLVSCLPAESVWFTILRDPVERAISYYHFIRRSPRHYCYDRVTQNKLSLEEFLTGQIDTLADNGQTRLLANLETGHEIPFGQCSKEMLTQAKYNLQTNMAVVGLTEQFDETLLLLQKAFGWRNIYYSRQNVSRNKSSQTELPASTLEVIRQTNQLDTALYQFAEQLFREQWQKWGDDAALVSFRRRNRQYAWFTKLRWQTRKFPLRTRVKRLFQSRSGS
ncbi:MAG TPA: hypothetical protein EYH05_00935 [Anaerolineae bacterium]|nr:hypothetical protein [Anaerolineae bacterium]